MGLARTIYAGATTLLLSVCLQTTAHAQGGIDPTRLDAVKDQLAELRALLDSLGDEQQQILSGGKQNLLQLARNWNQLQASLETLTPGDIQVLRGNGNPTPGQPGTDLARVSDPSSDFALSLLSGFTQSETSTAWCGNQVVTSFNDSGSLLETIPVPTLGLSFAGVAISSDRGGTFRDIGFINPGPLGSNSYNFLQGDGVVTCAPGPTNVFFISQILGTTTFSTPGHPAPPRLTAVGLSRSTDGGATWADPILVAPKSASTHSLDKPWSAIDPTNRNNMFITYTDFDGSGVVCGHSSTGAVIQRTAIELARSIDGGATWSAPLVIVQACSTSPGFTRVQGSQVAVDFLGNVYVAWEDFSTSQGTVRNLRIRRSTDHGLTFGPVGTISSVSYVGGPSGNGVLQGNVRNNEFPSLAIGPIINNTNTLYVVWNDGRDFGIPDLLFGSYHYGDILLSKSIDGGATWSVPIRVNNDPLSHMAGGRVLGTDHFQPGIAVDTAGTLGVCWYDRRSDPLNFLIGRACAVSSNGGASWDTSIFRENWSAIHGADFEVNTTYMGDYDTVARDSSGINAGFLGAFAVVSTGPLVLVPNQDVLMLSFQGRPNQH
jgi:hypothetical protein